MSDGGAMNDTEAPRLAGVGSVEDASPEITRIIVISGPGGVGKGTLVSKLIERDDRLWLSRSWTTRNPRPGEAADAYHFASTDEFNAHAANGGFVEWANFLDYMQGSPVPDPPSGKDVVFEIDVQGAARIAELYPDVLLLFIDAPSRDIQESRMRGRGDAEERISQRLQKAEEEVDRARSLPFTYVINDELDRTVEEVEALIRSHRSR